MKRYLKRIYWTAVGLTMAVALCVIAVLVIMRIDNTRETLRSILHTASAWTEESTNDLLTLAQNIANAAPPLRVTFIMDSGLVVADSEKNALYMDNHMDRPEIVKALTGGIGEDVRFSGTEGFVSLYAASRVSPSLLLRLSNPLGEILNFLIAYAASVLVMFLLLNGILRRMLARFARRMADQMSAVMSLLDGEGLGDESRVFEELRPAVRLIGYRVERLNADLSEIQDTLQIRQTFVANASHELKSPLTSIRGFADMLAEGMVDGPEEQAQFLSCIIEECDRMREVVEDVLMLSRAEILSDEPRVDVDVSRVAREIRDALKARALARGVTVEVSGEMTRNAVEKEIWEILYNLMDNAIKYGRDGGHVWVRLSAEEIRVEDDGIGIEEAHVPLLFEEFYRVDSGSMRGAGTGLGLSIVKRLADKYGAEIVVDSQIGVGSAFVVRFVSAV